MQYFVERRRLQPALHGCVAVAYPHFVRRSDWCFGEWIAYSPVACSLVSCRGWDQKENNDPDLD